MWLKLTLLTISIISLSMQPVDAQVVVAKASGYTTPFESGYNTLLYKIKLRYKKKFFSGLLLVKHNRLTEEHNIVCLSELGLSIMEYKYADGKMDLIKHTAFFDNKKVFNLMRKYFLILVQNVENNKTKVKNLSNGLLIKTRFAKNSGVKGRCFYLYDTNKKLHKIYAKGFLPLRYEIKLDKNDITTNVICRQNLLKLNIELSLLKKD